MKTSIQQVLRVVPVFRVCCVCKKMLGYQTDKLCSQYCAKCEQEMSKGANKVFQGVKT
ncbi:MAG: hypothetical protein KAS32_25295 [Candidatus Peribacteraceae bacterium]|nr:hypothetical protein [Candidatus Peribacteraceae bacterium]